MTLAQCHMELANKYSHCIKQMAGNIIEKKNIDACTLRCHDKAKFTQTEMETELSGVIVNL